MILNTKKVIEIVSFLNKYNLRMLRKTNYYDMYYNKDKEVNIDVIIKLSDNEVDKLHSEIENEKTYII